MLGALVPGVVLFAVVCARGRGVLLVPSLTVIALGLGAIELVDQVQIRKIVAPSLAATIEDMCGRGDTIWMYDGILAARYYRLPMPKAAAIEVASYFARADKATAVRNFLTAAKVSPIAAQALQSDFDEEEQVHLARWRALAAIDDSSLVCPFHFFRCSGDAKADESDGYVRGAFTDKSLREVRAALERPGDIKIIDVIGPAQTLAGLNLPMRDAGSGMMVVTKGAAH